MAESLKRYPGLARGDGVDAGELVALARKGKHYRYRIEDVEEMIQDATPFTPFEHAFVRGLEFGIRRRSDYRGIG